MASICCSPPDRVPAPLVPALLEPGKESEAVREVVRARTAGPAVGAQNQVFLHAHPAEHLTPLGHERDAATDQVLGFDRGDVLILERDDAAPRGQQSRDGLHERGLAGAVGADDRDDFALGDMDRYPVQRPDGTVVDADVPRRQQLSFHGNDSPQSIRHSRRSPHESCDDPNRCTNSEPEPTCSHNQCEPGTAMIARTSPGELEPLRPLPRFPCREFKPSLFLLEALIRELQCPAVLRDGAHDVIRSA